MTSKVAKTNMSKRPLSRVINLSYPFSHLTWISLTASLGAVTLACLVVSKADSSTERASQCFVSIF